MHPLIPYFSQPTIPLGPLTIHGFGIMVALGFWLGGNLAERKAVAFSGDPAAAERMNRMVGWLVVGTIVGGHLGEILMYEPGVLLTDPMKVLRFWDGLSSFGGFIACVPLAVWFFRKEGVPFWPNADALAWGFGLGFGLGRVGCFLAHDHPGTPTNFWLGVKGICPGGGPELACHDMGLYEALAVFAMLGLFKLASLRPRPHGFYIGLLPAIYGPIRFGMEFMRADTVMDVRYAGLTPAQYGSLVLTGLGAWILATRGTTVAPAHAG